MGGLKPSREVAIRSTVDALPLLLFRPGGSHELCAMTVELGPSDRVGDHVALSGEAVEEIHALTTQILKGRQLTCGARFETHVCCLDHNHAPVEAEGGFEHCSSAGVLFNVEVPF